MNSINIFTNSNSINLQKKVQFVEKEKLAFTDQTSLHLYETAEITHQKTWDNLVLKENEKNFMKKFVDSYSSN